MLQVTDSFGLNDSAWNNKGSTTVLASFVGFHAIVRQLGSGVHRQIVAVGLIFAAGCHGLCVS